MRKGLKHIIRDSEYMYVSFYNNNHSWFLLTIFLSNVCKKEHLLKS